MYEESAKFLCPENMIVVESSLLFYKMVLMHTNYYDCRSTMSASDYSPDESGYITSRVRRNSPNPEEYDPYEHGDEDTANSPARSLTPIPLLAGEGTSRGPRTIRTARKSVLPLRRVTFTVPATPTGESSQSRSQSQTVASSPPAVGIPAPRPQGMTAEELEWTTRVANEVMSHRQSLNHFRNSFEGMVEIQHRQDDVTYRVMDIALDAGEAARRTRVWQLWMLGAWVILFVMVLISLMR